MDKERRQSGPKFTPEKTKAWTLALYPAAVLLGVAYMIVEGKPITTDVIGLFVGLLTAGTLQLAVNRNGVRNVDSGNNNNSGDDIHNPSNQKLEDLDWGGPDDSNRWFYPFINARRRKMGRLSATG